jgi:hypothetical protein
MKPLHVELLPRFNLVLFPQFRGEYDLALDEIRVFTK